MEQYADFKKATENCIKEIDKFNKETSKVITDQLKQLLEATTTMSKRMLATERDLLIQKQDLQSHKLEKVK